MYGAASFEELEVGPEANYKRYLIVAVLEDRLVRPAQILEKRYHTISGINPAASVR